MKIVLFLGLALFASAWLQATALMLSSAGLEIQFAKAVNVYNGWAGLALAALAFALRVFRKVRTRSEKLYMSIFVNKGTRHPGAGRGPVATVRLDPGLRRDDAIGETR